MFSWKNLDWFLPRVEESHRKERMTEPPGHMCSPEPQRAWSPLSGTHSPPWRRAGWRFPPELCLNLIKWKNSSESPSCLLQRHRGSPCILKVRRSNGALSVVPAHRCAAQFLPQNSRAPGWGWGGVELCFSEPWGGKEGLREESLEVMVGTGTNRWVGRCRVSLTSKECAGLTEQAFCSYNLTFFLYVWSRGVVNANGVSVWPWYWNIDICLSIYIYLPKCTDDWIITESPNIESLISSHYFCWTFQIFAL